MYKNIIKIYYDMFVDIVTSARPAMSKEKLIQEYGAGIFPAAQAKEYSYIDGANMNRNDVLKLLLKELNIDDDYYQVVQLDDTSWISKVFNNKNPLFQGKVTHTVNLPQEIDPKLSGQFLYLYSPFAGK
jgi:ClpP class serine protease